MLLGAGAAAILQHLPDRRPKKNHVMKARRQTWSYMSNPKCIQGAMLCSCQKFFNLAPDWIAFKASVTALKHTNEVKDSDSELDVVKMVAEKAFDPKRLIEYINF